MDSPIEQSGIPVFPGMPAFPTPDDTKFSKDVAAEKKGLWKEKWRTGTFGFEGDEILREARVTSFRGNVKHVEHRI